MDDEDGPAIEVAARTMTISNDVTIRSRIPISLC
jgi:hypothetical protein